MDPITGFGMTKMPRKLEVFQPFFVSLNLPYSIKRGEVVSIPIVCFNYMDTDITAEVTFDNTAQDFDFVDVAEEGSDSPSKLLQLPRKALLFTYYKPFQKWNSIVASPLQSSRAEGLPCRS